MEFKSKIKTIEWVDTYSKMVDQTVIPYEYKFVNITSGHEMFDAIRNMIVRGAPAIGIAGAHGVILYAQSLAKENLSREEFVKKLIEKAEYMKTSRPFPRLESTRNTWISDAATPLYNKQNAPSTPLVTGSL